MKISLLLAFLSLTVSAHAGRPHILLVMADDMGWGQTGYYDHPVLKTPNLDAMAKSGLRFDRFYAGAPNCSPTRATVLTGRSNDRTGVENHGYPLRLQEKTVARALREAGYRTAHFGKWHLNGLRGAGAPVLGSDTHHPGEFGFDDWLSVTNFFDRDPILSRKGTFEEFKGDSSEIVAAEALKYFREHKDSGQPIFSVVWFGTPHSPFVASDEDKAAFADLKPASANHYGELVAMDRAIGALRSGLREMEIADDTLFWFCSDNGGLPEVKPSSTGGLRGFKGTVYEGGLRVPAIIEWPGGIRSPRVTSYPAGTVDIFPTLAAVTGLPESAMLQPADGISLKPLFTDDIKERAQPLFFRHQNRGAAVDNRFKLIALKMDQPKFELYDLEKDPAESRDATADHPEVAARLGEALTKWNRSVEASVAGKDYPEGKVDPNQPMPRSWTEDPAYEPYLEEWKDRPEFRGYIQGKAKKRPKKK